MSQHKSQLTAQEIQDSEKLREVAAELIEDQEYDPVTAEVLKMRFENVVDEMGTTLHNTSGSPILTEAYDFSTNILYPEGGITSTGAYLTFHVGAARESLDSILNEFDREEINPGDTFLLNMTYQGPMHKQDVGTLTPMFYDGEIVNWFWTAGHLADLGGLSPGTFSPKVTDTYGEGVNIPPIKFVEEGEINETAKELLKAQSRVPTRMINDIRCFIGSNNVARDRLSNIVEEYGLEQYRVYSEIVSQLTERAMRRRIEQLPDGSYSTRGWLEHEGHENNLYNIDCELRVDGDELTLDFSGTHEQVQGFINTGPGGSFGCSVTPLIHQLAWDLQINKGLFEPITVEAPSGTVLNAEPPAPTGYGHLDAGHEACRQVTEVISHAVRMSDDEELQERASGQFNDDWSIETYFGTSQYDTPYAWLHMDGGGMGGGAQTRVDGLDVAGLYTQTGNAVPDIEWKEQAYPALFLWRSLEADSGGPGEYRGGRGLDVAFQLWDTPDEKATGAIAGARFNIPPRGFGGGQPGATSRFQKSLDTNIDELIEDEIYPDQASLEWEDTHLTENKEAPHHLEQGTIMRHWTGGGGGLGDPLKRDPGAVAREVRSGWLSREAAENAYGVVLDEDDRVDETATEQRREQIRELRLDQSGVEN